MLQELDVENYAVAEKLRIRFHAGLNLLTGETGSGKSIVVDALSLLLSDDDVRRAWHDSITRTYVVMKPRATAPVVGVESIA